jgi:hypothetical protein
VTHSRASKVLVVGLLVAITIIASSCNLAGESTLRGGITPTPVPGDLSRLQIEVQASRTELSDLQLRFNSWSRWTALFLLLLATVILFAFAAMALYNRRTRASLDKVKLGLEDMQQDLKAVQQDLKDLRMELTITQHTLEKHLYETSSSKHTEEDSKARLSQPEQLPMSEMLRDFVVSLQRNYNALGGAGFVSLDHLQKRMPDFTSFDKFLSNARRVYPGWIKVEKDNRGCLFLMLTQSIEDI